MDYSGNYAMYNGSESQSQLPPPHPPQMTYGTSTHQRDNSLSQPVFQFEVPPSQSPLPPFHLTPIQNEQVKPQVSAQDKGKGKENSPLKPRGGRQQGVTNFGASETQELLRVVRKWLPIGLDGWTGAKDEYNQFAKKNKLRERDCRSLKQKFEKTVYTAQTKPTGEANRSELLTMALEINGLLDAKAGTGVLDDDLSDEGGKFGGEAEASEKEKVIQLNSDGEEAADEPSKALVVKGYRTANPLEVKTRGTRASTSQAVDAMSAISTYFSPDRERERADRRAEARASIASNSVLVAQLQSAQTDLQEVRSELREVRSELREANSENKRLSDSLRAETHRADKLDLHVIRLQDKVEQLEVKNRELMANLDSMRSHHHRHDKESNTDSESDSSPHERKRRRRHSHHPPSVSQKTVAIGPDGTKSPSMNSPKASVVALPAGEDHSL